MAFLQATASPSNVQSSTNFTNPSNVYASDDSRAVSTTSSAEIELTGFGFSIPSDAVVTNVEVWTEGFDTDANVDARWIINGSVVGTSQSGLLTMGTTSTDELTAAGWVGGVFSDGRWIEANTWPTAAEVNASNFGVVIEAIDTGPSYNVELDHVQMRITYATGYQAAIVALGADHLYEFDGDSTDSIGTADGTGSGVVYTSSAIAEDATNCMETNGTTDRVTLPTTTNINNSAQTRKAVCGWFTPTAIQNPPKNIYGEGDATQAFRFILGWGNYLMFEVDSASYTLQIFGDVELTPNREYHLTMIFEGSGYGNELRAYLDGVKQLSAEPTNRQPGATTLPARTVGEFGDPAGTVAVGGTAVIIIAPINGKYNHWATFDGANAVLTDTEVREELFEKGALPDITISSGTESAMQTALDAYADTVRGDAPLCIRIEANTGDTNFTLDADNITFNEKASIHVQYMGTATLTWRNLNGSDASIFSTPNDGTVTKVDEHTLTLTGLIAGSEVRVYDAFGASATEIGGIESSGTSFSVDTTEATVDVAIHDEDLTYISFEGVDMSSGDVTIDVTQRDDRVYLNPT